MGLYSLFNRTGMQQKKCYINHNYQGDRAIFYYVFVTISYFRERIHSLVFDA